MLHEEAASTGELVRLRGNDALDQRFLAVVVAPEIDDALVVVALVAGFSAFRELLEARLDAYFLFFFRQSGVPPPGG